MVAKWQDSDEPFLPSIEGSADRELNGLFARHQKKFGKVVSLVKVRSARLSSLV